MEKLKDIFMYILGALIFLLFFAIVGVLIWKEIPSPNYELLYMLLGILGAKFSDVVSYFFGSSKGSSDKTKLMNGHNIKE